MIQRNALLSKNVPFREGCFSENETHILSYRDITLEVLRPISNNTKKCTKFPFFWGILLSCRSKISWVINQGVENYLSNILQFCKKSSHEHKMHIWSRTTKTLEFRRFLYK